MTHGRLSRKNNAVFPCRRVGGFTLFELMVVILLLCGIYYVVIERLMYYRTQYESAEVRWTLAAIRSSGQVDLALRKGGLLVRKPSVASPNPMRMLAPLPRNYLGEMCDPDLAEVEPGNWYFDPCNSWLVYVYNHEKLFALGHPKILKFNVESLRLLTDPARTS
jgi:hypothetical protein